jgi:hypothetical protein
MEREALEALPSRELHDRAVSHAVKHLNVSFLWELISAVPAAEAAAGHMGEARSDVMSLRSLLTDTFNQDNEGELAEALRPLYLDYLEKHA